MLESSGRVTIHWTSCRMRAVTICTLQPLDNLQTEQDTRHSEVHEHVLTTAE